ncbi:MAG: hypothetical protein H6569_08050 [Lewinellaceae bacterium]|nr:hypothetical protein [Lewinellaceae bacterium]
MRQSAEYNTGDLTASTPKPHKAATRNGEISSTMCEPLSRFGNGVLRSGGCTMCSLLVYLPIPVDKAPAIDGLYPAGAGINVGWRSKMPNYIVSYTAVLRANKPYKGQQY